MTTAPLAARRLGGALAAYYAVFVLVVTLHPFVFRAPRPPDPFLLAGPFDLVANVALFVPLGFLLRLARSAAPRWELVLLGTGLSVVVELAQLFEPSRFSAAADVWANGFGAALGVLVHDGLARRLRAPDDVTRRLALELPLVALLYLALPLAWLDALTSAGRATGGLPLLLLGLFGASVLASVHAAHLSPWGMAGRGATTAVAGAWFVVATLPAWRAEPLPLLVQLLLVALFAWWRAGRLEPVGGERRWEGRALLRAAPYYGAYLLLLPFGAPAGTGPLHERLGILHAAEGVAAFTLLGYLVAEARGRREHRWPRGVAPAFPLAAGAVVLGRVL
ncbi:MAG TPA: VanZ family protein, partial [Gemmatimonadaceae bacterium]|nr:VanZ family protein [Gemmatimonadaceae bacterium]